MDWRNEESDYSSVQNVLWDENLLSKTKSNVSLLGVFGCNVCSQGVQANFINCRESRSFTSAFEQLELDAKNDCKGKEFPFQKSCDVQTEPFEDFERDISAGFRTREILSFRTSHQDVDILNYQGMRYSPEDVAPFWKKDSRMWLWKSVKRMRKKEKTEDSETECKK